MQKNESSFLERFILAFVLANIIFLLLILLTFSISNLNYKRIAGQTNEIKQTLERFDEFLQINSLDCTTKSLNEASVSLDRVGIKINILETRFGKNDKRVLEQKKLYSELELKHFSLIKKIEEICGKEKIKILFFYSNSKEKEEESDRVGVILSSFKKQNPENIMIYSFDFNLDFEIVSELKKKYEITSAPSVVINEKEPIYIKNINELNNYVANQ